MLGAVEKLEIRNQVWICLGSTYIHVSLWKSFCKQHLQVVALHTTMELVNYLFLGKLGFTTIWTLPCHITYLSLQSAIFLRERAAKIFWVSSFTLVRWRNPRNAFSGLIYGFLDWLPKEVPTGLESRMESISGPNTDSRDMGDPKALITKFEAVQGPITALQLPKRPLYLIGFVSSSPRGMKVGSWWKGLVTF